MKGFVFKIDINRGGKLMRQKPLNKKKKLKIKKTPQKKKNCAKETRRK